jgi:hypothetical protein
MKHAVLMDQGVWMYLATPNWNGSPVRINAYAPHASSCNGMLDNSLLKDRGIKDRQVVVGPVVLVTSLGVLGGATVLQPALASAI